MPASRASGRVGSTKLPGNGAWAGPTLAGDHLWLTSTGGTLVSVEATTGKVTGQKELGGAFYIGPVVAQGRMYVLSDSAKLMALN